MRRRQGADVPVGLVIVTAFTAWVSLLAWSGFVEQSSRFLAPALLGIIAVTLVGVLARRFRMPTIFVLSGQVLTILVFVNAVWGSAVVPTPGSVRETAQAFVDSVDILAHYAAPVPANLTRAMPVLVLGGLVCHLMADFFALTLGRVPLAGLPLLFTYTLPVSVLDRPVLAIVFVAAVTGYLMMLALDEGSSINRWGRDFGNDGHGSERGPLGPPDPRRHPLALGASATVLALVVPLFLPSLGLQLFGDRDGPGSGDGEVRITNPIADLRRDLQRQADVPLLRVSTSGPRPRYLRTSVLTTFTGDTWTPGDRNLPSENTADGPLPRPIGLSPDVPASTQEWQIRSGSNFTSLWLPTPANLASIEAGEDWRFDDSVLDFHAADDDTNTAGFSYSLTELIPQFTSEQLSAAPPPDPTIARDFSTIPSDLPDSVSAAAEEVTGGLTSNFEQALALQNWFRDEGEFTYSLEPSAGNGNNALEEFVEERIGYCEQFASAMAVMARQVGIPARVAVGFYQAEEVGDDLYVFSSHDLHAWPELYFEDYGWVRFEPTPSSHIGSTPSYTQESPDSADQPDSPTTEPSAEPSTRAPSPAAPSAAPEPAQASDGSDDAGFPWAILLWGLAGVLLVIGLLLVPRLLRRRRATQRWRGGSDPVEAAWEELRDVCLDLRLPWPDGRSPRTTGAAVCQWFGPAEVDPATRLPRTGPEVNPEALAALESLVHALEERRYAPTRSGDDVEGIRRDLATCVRALENGVPRETRFRAEWTPASVLRRRTPPTVTADEDTDQLAGDHVG